MTTDREVIEQFLKGLIPEIQASQEEKGLTASGASGRLLEVVMLSDSIGQLVDGSGSFVFQQYGRGATTSKTKGKKTLQQIIYDWLEFKKYGLNWSATTGEGLRGVTEDKKRISLSYAISKKIHKKGTYTKIENRNTNVLSDIINDSRLRPLIEVFAERNAAAVSSDIAKLLTL